MVSWKWKILGGIEVKGIIERLEPCVIFRNLVLTVVVVLLHVGKFVCILCLLWVK